VRKRRSFLRPWKASEIGCPRSQQTTNRNLAPEEQEYLANIRTLGRSKFGECFDVDSVSIETIYNKLAEDDALGPEKLSVELQTTVATSGDILFIGATKLRDIFRFVQGYKAASGDLDLLYEKKCEKVLRQQAKGK
jgi:hypothetical protein